MAPPLGIRLLCLIRPTKQLVASIHDWLRYFILNFQYTVVHFERIYFYPHKHRWPSLISTFYYVVYPVESQCHQYWSFFVVSTISVSLVKLTEIHFTTDSKIHYWCAGSFSISFLNTNLMNELVSILLVISMWIARLAKHLKEPHIVFRCFFFPLL